MKTIIDYLRFVRNRFRVKIIYKSDTCRFAEWTSDKDFIGGVWHRSTDDGRFTYTSTTEELLKEWLKERAKN